MPLDNGIWRYDESESASPTFSELLNRLGDSVRARLAADLVGSGPVALHLSAGASVYIHRVGPIATVWAEGTDTIPALARPHIGNPNIIPAGFRPARDVTGTAELRWLTNGVGALTVDRFGSVLLWNPTATANSNWSGSVTYTVGA